MSHGVVLSTTASHLPMVPLVTAQLLMIRHLLTPVFIDIGLALLAATYSDQWVSGGQIINIIKCIMRDMC